jgi:uncharacterized protein YndB with AHSA1/START domain
MSVNERVFNASPQAVWNVLSDGWLYPLWVVGATRMREVDDNWPQAGSKLHHSVGVWPAVIDDYTEVLEVEPLRRLALRARGWPMGEAKVVLELEERGSTTNVRIIEDATAGPGMLVPAPLRHPMIKVRNVEALERLAHLVEGRAHEGKG